MTTVTIEGLIEGLLDVADVARLLKVEPRTVYEWTRQGKLRRHPGTGRLVRYAPLTIKRFIEGGVREPRPIARTPRRNGQRPTEAEPWRGSVFG